MYSEKLAIAVKANGQVLRELGDTVILPFGTEFSVLVKNLNSKRASVKIWIDGTNVAEGVSLVVEANDSIELERFIKNGNLSQGNRFKFIEKSAAVVAHRGNKIDDGTIRVEFQYESIQPFYHRPTPIQWTNDCRGISSSGTLTTSTTNSGASYTVSNSSANLNSIRLKSFQPSATAYASQISDGITAPGSISDQQFQTVSNFCLESQTYAIVLKMQGEHTGKRVSNPVTVKSRTSCSMCGKKESPSAKFCSRCGASLQLIQ